MIVQYVNQQRKHKTRQWKLLIDRILPTAFAASNTGKEFLKLQVTPLVTVTFYGPRNMRRLNREARQVDNLTDILSFPMLEFVQGSLTRELADYDLDPAYAPEKVVPLGDLVLSLDQAFTQAENYGHSREREVAFLALHGLLHLLGYDHIEPQDEQIMRRMQRQLLKEINMDIKGELEI